MDDTIGNVLGGLVCVGLSCGAIVILNLMWTSLSGRRHEGMDDEYESCPCLGCGYDLRGITTACPECGRLVRVEDVASPLSTEFDVRKLRDEWPKSEIESVAPQPWEPLTEIYSTRDGWLTDLLLDQLTARGVWARVNAKSSEEVVGALAHTVTVHSIAVADADVADAAAVLDIFRIRKNAFLNAPQQEADAGQQPVLDYQHGQGQSPPQHRQS